jgi:hypothetical protein
VPSILPSRFWRKKRAKISRRRKLISGRPMSVSFSQALRVVSSSTYLSSTQALSEFVRVKVVHEMCIGSILALYFPS